MGRANIVDSLVLNSAGAGLLYADLQFLSEKEANHYRGLMSLTATDLFAEADTMNRRGDWENALLYYAVIINNYEINPVQQGDLAQRLYAESLCRSGDIYYRRGMYPNAMEYYLKGMRVCDAGRIKDIQANLYKNIGNIYCSYNDFAMGSTYYDDAVRLALEIQDTTLLSRLYYNQAGAYCLGGNIGKAQEAYDKMVAVSDTGSPMDQYSLLMVKGMLQESGTDAREAIGTYKTTASYALEKGFEYRYVGSAYSGMARIYERTGQLDSALFYLKENERMGKESMQMDLLIHTYRQMSEIYREEQDMDKSMMYKFMYLNLADSVMNQKNFNDLKNAQFLSEMARHKETIQQLNQEQKERELQISSQRRLLLTVSCFLIFVMVLLLVVYRQKRSLSVAYNDLFDRNQEQLSLEVFYKKRLSALEAELQRAREDSELVSGMPCEEPRFRMDELENEEKGIAAARTSCPPAYRERLLSDIQHVMDDTLEFCSSDFSVEKLATLVNSNSRYVSSTIHEVYGKNFRAFLNEYRIKEAMRRLSDVDSYGQYTIQAIAESVRYKSQANFIAVFTKQTGIKPSMYQKLSKQRA